MESSKVIIKVKESSVVDHFNTYTHSSGTIGSVNVGADVGYAIKSLPRPLHDLAKAVDVVAFESEAKSNSAVGRFIKAAKELAALYDTLDAVKYKEFDMKEINNLNKAIYGFVEGEE